jgi:hypothetical protein
MKNTQLACPHCGSTLTFGTEIAEGTPVTCLICSQAFAAAKPVYVGAAGSSPAKKANSVSTKPAAPTRRPAPKRETADTEAEESGSNPALLICTIALLVLLTGGVAFGVWKMTAGKAGPADDPDVKLADNSKNDTKPGDKNTANPKSDAGGQKSDAGPKSEDLNPKKNGDPNPGISNPKKDPDNPPKKSNPNDPDDGSNLKDENKLKRKDPPPPPMNDEPKVDPIEVVVKSKNTTAPKVVGIEPRRVQETVDRGIAHLKKTQTGTGTWGSSYPLGMSAIGGLTLLECGVPADDPHVQRSAAFVRTNVGNLVKTYELSAIILFLDRLGDPRDRALIQELALRLLAGQNENGGWTYDSRLLNTRDYYHFYCFLRSNQPPNFHDKNKERKGGDPFMQLDDVLVNRALEFKDTNIAALPGEKSLPAGRIDPSKGAITAEYLSPTLRYLGAAKFQGVKKTPVQFLTGEGDSSNTQFAMLALWAARRHGVPTDQALIMCYRRYASTQKQDGGWGYFLGEPSNNTMTNVGLLGLALGHGASPDLMADPKNPGKQIARPALEDQSIKFGLQALSRYVGQPVADPSRVKFEPENIYFLWSVERVGMLYDLNSIGGKDWYSWGAQILVGTQTANGDWNSAKYPGSEIPELNTCLALLFLRRSNLVHDLTTHIRLDSAIRDPR